MLGNLVMNHAGRGYAYVVDGETTIIKGAIILFYFWGVEQDLIPNMQQMVFAYVLIQG